jgi:hypothetical protein
VRVLEIEKVERGFLRIAWRTEKFWRDGLPRLGTYHYDGVVPGGCYLFEGGVRHEAMAWESGSYDSILMRSVWA